MHFELARHGARHRASFQEVLRRNEISLRAHYAQDLEELYDLLEPEGIDYFIFNRTRFYPEALAKETYFEPLRGLVESLTARNYMDYAYKLLPRQVDLSLAPFMPFRDDQSVIIDLNKLGKYLRNQNEVAH